jgi:hypothetical protein
VAASGEDEFDDTFCLIFNASLTPLTFALPPIGVAPGGTWEIILETAHERLSAPPYPLLAPGDALRVPDLAMIVARAPRVVARPRS